MSTIYCGGCATTHPHEPEWGEDGLCRCSCCIAARDARVAAANAEIEAAQAAEEAAREERRVTLLAIKPMKFASADTADVDVYAYDREYIFQQKLDGMRAVVCCNGRGEVEVIGGAGGPSTSTTIAPTVARLKDAFAKVSASGQVVALDGEIVDGVFHAFDLPRWGWHHGRLPVRPEVGFVQRYRALDTFLSSAGLDEELVRAVPIARSALEKWWLWDTVRERGLEGVIARGRWKPYIEGRTDHSVKLKITYTVDCVVTARDTNGKANASLGLYDGSGELVPVGQCSMIGKPDAHIGDVVEVKYLYAGAGGLLVQPSVMRLREPSDKRPTECTVDQLRRVNKEVVDPIEWHVGDKRVGQWAPEREAAERKRRARKEELDAEDGKRLAAIDPRG